MITRLKKARLRSNPAFRIWLASNLFIPSFANRSERDAMKTFCCGALTVRWILAIVLIPATGLAEVVPLKRVVELALSHSTGAAMVAADEQRASATYRELRNNYIPQVATGAGLGFSYGFPLALEGSAPGLFNITTQ